MIKTKQNIWKWEDYKYNLQNKIITNHLLYDSLLKFWSDIINVYSKENQFIFIQFKVQISSGVIRSVSKVQIVTSSDFYLLLESFKIFWEIKSEDYHISSIESIVFTYKFIGKQEDIIESKILKPKQFNLISNNLFNFKGYQLPTTMDFTE